MLDLRQKYMFKGMHSHAKKISTLRILPSRETDNVRIDKPMLWILLSKYRVLIVEGRHSLDVVANEA